MKNELMSKYKIREGERSSKFENDEKFAKSISVKRVGETNKYSC